MPLPAEMYQTAALIPFFQIATSKPSDLKHQLRANKHLAETYSAFHFVTKELCSFKKLKELVEEVYLSSKSSPGLVSPRTAFRLAVTFLEALVDIDEADKQNKVFVQQDPSHVHGGKQKRMSCTPTLSLYYKQLSIHNVIHILSYTIIYFTDRWKEA